MERISKLNEKEFQIEVEQAPQITKLNIDDLIATRDKLQADLDYYNDLINKAKAVGVEQEEPII